MSIRKILDKPTSKLSFEDYELIDLIKLKDNLEDILFEVFQAGLNAGIDAPIKHPNEYCEYVQESFDDACQNNQWLIKLKEF